jgi:hypothetical protein
VFSPVFIDLRLPTFIDIRLPTFISSFPVALLCQVALANPKSCTTGAHDRTLLGANQRRITTPTRKHNPAYRLLTIKSRFRCASPLADVAHGIVIRLLSSATVALGKSFFLTETRV